MEYDASLLSLVIVLIAAFFTPVLLHRFRLAFMPVVIAEILIGLIIGKSGLNLVHDGMWLETLSTLGFIFLMFLSGLEIDFDAFKPTKKKKQMPNGKNEPQRLGVSISIFLGIFALSVLLSFVFVKIGLIDDILLMTIIISTISLGVVVPTLKEANIMKTSIGQIILLIAVIADLVTMILLAVFVSITDEGASSVWLLLILFGAGIILYFVAQRFIGKDFFTKLSEGTVQIGTRAVFTLIIVLVGLSESVGAENILGAFLAGTLVSLLKPKPELVRQLDSFGYGFLIPIFFVMVGVDIELWSLLSNKQMLLLIPLLLIALFISKIIPVYILKLWFDRNTVIASAFLLTSTLSLVIAAAKIAEGIGAITPEMSGTLILVAVISCIITPILFKKFFPQDTDFERKQEVIFIGANQLTLQTSRNLNKDLFEWKIYHRKTEKINTPTTDSKFTITELDHYDKGLLKKHGVFESDILFMSTGDEVLNAELARVAKQEGVDRVIVRMENPHLAEEVQREGIEVFSTILSTTTLMTALIESPNIADIMTNQDTSLYEIEMLNPGYHGMTLRKFPLTGDVIFVRIFRDNDSIVPHGDTELHMNDTLVVTGSKEFVDELMQELQF